MKRIFDDFNHFWSLHESTSQTTSFASCCQQASCIHQIVGRTTEFSYLQLCWRQHRAIHPAWVLIRVPQRFKIAVADTGEICQRRIRQEHVGAIATCDGQIMSI